jgi:phosphatidylglycerol:prolipoprotein diacylglycerol transferase
VEFFREPDRQLGFIVENFSMGQLLSFPMLLLGMGMVWWTYKKGRSG